MSRPGAIDWPAVVPSKNQPPPEMFVRLPPHSLITSFYVLVRFARVIVITIYNPDGQYDRIEKVVPANGRVTIFAKEDGSPVEADKFGISPEGSTEPEAETYDMTVTVNGCFEPSAGK